MANDRYCFLVLEESLPEGTIAEHRKARRPKAKRPSPAKRPRLPTWPSTSLQGALEAVEDPAPSALV
jgi:hypothetical protein